MKPTMALSLPGFSTLALFANGSADHARSIQLRCIELFKQERYRVPSSLGGLLAGLSTRLTPSSISAPPPATTPPAVRPIMTTRNDFDKLLGAAKVLSNSGDTGLIRGVQELLPASKVGLCARRDRIEQAATR